jgi:hypothetical protein
MKNIYKIFIIIFTVVFCIVPAFAQSISISGFVKDAQTQEPLPFVNVFFTNTATGTQTADNGYFSISNNAGARSITISSLGYKDQIILLDSAKITGLLVLLEPTDFQLNEVVVHKEKNRYTKKDNPAVEFMREVIARKNDNRIEAKPQYHTKRYEKFMTYLDKFNSSNTLALSIKETFADVYFRKTPHALKETVKARREEGIWKDFDKSISQNMQELFREVNLYSNTIDLFYSQFVSPLSSTLSMTTYKYYIEDTVAIDNIQYLKMFFSPFNPQSIGFIGSLYFTMDGKYALKKAELHVPKKTNLNFADNLTITQNFAQLSDSTWVMSDENLSVNLYLFKGIPELLLQRIRLYQDYNFDYQDDAVYNFSISGGEDDEQETEESEDYWIANRPIPLKGKEESSIEKLLAELRKNPVYKTIVRTSDFFSSGYFVAGGNKEKSKFNIGPLGSIVSTNDVEGLHFRLGGTTTANLSNRIFASGHLAYGVYDRQLKYNAKLTYSFLKKKYHENEFPRNKISIMYDYDLYSPGAVFQENKDNFLVAWRVGRPVTKMSYLRRSIIHYEKDLSVNWRIGTFLKHQIDQPAGTLKYQYIDDSGSMQNINRLTTFEWGVTLAYRIGGKPFDGINRRMDLAKRTTEFGLSHYAGIKNILGGGYNYQRTEFSVKSRVQMSIFGYVDTKIKAGKVWTKSPFPLLFIPNAYQSILIQPDAFQMMNALEFVADQYIGLNADYHLNGLLFNRIPLFNLLKLREVISFNGIYGRLSDRNNPQKTPGLFILPNGTKPLGSPPYLEVGAGVENIFKVFRIEYFRRLNYHESNTRKGGFLLSFGFTF